MNSFKKHIINMLITVSSIVLIVSAFNYTLDFYGVFSVRKVFKDFTPNEHSLKLNFILSEENRSNLIFGNSRSGVVNSFDKYRSWYNMSYSMGVPEEFLMDLKKIFNERSDINEVLIFLDEVSLFEIYKNHKNQVLRKVVDLNSFDRFQYLFILPTIDVLSFMISSLIKNPQVDKTIVYDIYKSGATVEKNFDYDNSELICAENTLVKNFKSYPLIDLFKEKLAVLKEIKSLAEKNNVKIKFISQPFSSRYFLDGFRVRTYFEFLEFLEDQGFKVNKPTKCLVLKHKDGQWRDLHHYNKVVGEQIENKFLY